MLVQSLDILLNTEVGNTASVKLLLKNNGRFNAHELIDHKNIIRNYAEVFGCEKVNDIRSFIHFVLAKKADATNLARQYCYQKCSK